MSYAFGVTVRRRTGEMGRGRKDNVSDEPDDYDWMSIFPRWSVAFAEWLGLVDKTT